jgi:alkylation response protein AidB-like acyl-CoA dehydrogenase
MNPVLQNNRLDGRKVLLVMQRDVFSTEHEDFRATVRQFVAKHLDEGIRAEMAHQHGVPRTVWHEAGHLGLLGLSVPEEFGGSGADDFRFNAVLTEELATPAMAFASSFGIHTDVVAPYLVELGTDEQKNKWLPGYCSGAIVGAIAMTEPGAGSDLASLSTKATRRGEEWILNGSKTFITNGASADLVVVAARTGEPGARGISLFVVESGTPGFERGRTLDKVGQPEADTAELTFDNATIPAGNLLGDLNVGFRHMMERLPQERIHGAVANTAHAYAVFDQTLAYVKTRHAFGQPIGRFQHIRMSMADLETELDVTRAFTDLCVTAHAKGRLDPADAAKAKLWSSEVQNRVIDACVQLHGGYGYMNEYAVARAWTDARVTRIWGGTSEVMKEVIGRRLGL